MLIVSAALGTSQLSAGRVDAGIGRVIAQVSWTDCSGRIPAGVSMLFGGMLARLAVVGVTGGLRAGYELL